MRASIVLVVLLASPALAAEAPSSIRNARVEIGSGTPASAFARIGRGATGEWLGWSVPSVPQAESACCFSRSFEVRGCSLADPDEGWGMSTDDGTKRATDTYVLVEAKRGRPSRLRVVSPGCAVEGAGRRLVWLGPADPAASIEFLSRIASGGEDRDGVVQPALAAIAYHADARADAFLEKRALDRSLDDDEREQAIFWAGNARGARGYDLLDRILDDDPSADIRQHAAFALSQSDTPGAVDRIKRVALEDHDESVRAHAFFCLSQTRAPGAGEWIVGRLDAEKDDHVREQAVFALSQLPDGTDWLLRVLRSKRDPETVRRALFWLGQSNDPRALEEIEKILDR